MDAQKNISFGLQLQEPNLAIALASTASVSQAEINADNSPRDEKLRAERQLALSEWELADWAELDLERSFWT